ncbi:sodium-extruding oxaloacetate decarboxylase subunit alpha [Gilvimarinus sp. SDUM040013]|uniref:Sodium-extruding oxaloacetate decarboxylase subunit alpha n=1 Tax=Gilvimarinus gilvus TaxID=3058038 RepID=A0ABU4S460_9GAMM|nr:sodium-extruding oxaloacetate decarboxylase subunit alpha [Gilvimarinus sp. SDUM040013]MDO3384353.1 sodium-extruding oxaloacetate decarboxylase subunit alpha [Gilvimarinus sp. SDUM040013]MDX6851201.1 sodium-extruding oxaloacetate decarboxylase subunit alpha [Gilvimarinus sp. SDUM040013]
MSEVKKPLGITDVVLRDAHQSLFATRMRLDDMLPIAQKLDDVGFWSLETWGGATFDSCIRYLGEDPWHRIRELKKAMPKTPMQMLLRGQNLLGYRHYGDDVVAKFVERAAANGVDVFRVFDAMNDMRNIEAALKAVKEQGKHAQGTISYTLSPVHTLEGWVEQGKRIEDMGADSIAIKDMAGLLKPYVGYELVKRLKESCDIPIHMQSHATTGLAHATNLKCVEAGIDNVDTAISSMSMTYGHSPTETLVATLEGTERDTGLDIYLLEEIAGYFREVRKKYAKFEGALKGVDSRILVAQVPGGMLTNMENQLREQNATDKLDDVLAEIPKVREDLGFIPLVTPTSQIVGSQAVLNVLTGERYKTITRETEGVLKGEYGAAPAPVNKELQQRVLGDADPITCRPADLIEPEFDKLTTELLREAQEKGIELSEGAGQVDDVLTYALFPQVGLKFLQNRNNPDAFEPVPTGKESSVPTTDSGEEIYTVDVEGKKYTVTVASGGDITGIGAVGGAAASAAAPASGGGEPVPAPLGGTIVRLAVQPGEQVAEGDTLLILEAMKMESEVSAPRAGTVTAINVQAGDAVAAGDNLLSIG